MFSVGSPTSRRKPATAGLKLLIDFSSLLDLSTGIRAWDSSSGIAHFLFHRAYHTLESLSIQRKSESDGHPIIENYVLVSHVARHLKRNVTPHAPAHNCDYRTPGVSLVISLYLSCAHVLRVPHTARLQEYRVVVALLESTSGES